MIRTFIFLYPVLFLVACLTEPEPDARPDRTSDLDGDGYSPEEGDCDDEDPEVHPGATEVCNEVDDDCDRYWDADRDTGEQLRGPCPPGCPGATDCVCLYGGFSCPDEH